MCKLSVVVPIYNVEKYLDKCLESICGQTLKDLEIICVIDASPDNCLEICKKWQEKDPRIKIINETVNKGLGLTRNIGIEHATGDFIAFIDSDDYIAPEMYEKLYDLCIKNNLDAAFCDYVRDTDGVISGSREPKTQFLCLGRKEVDAYLYDFIAPLPEYPSDVKYLVSVWRGLYSLELLRKHNILFESERLNASEDIPFNIDFLMKAERIGYIPYKGYYYRYTPTSLSRGYTHKKFEAYRYLLREIKSRLESHADPKEWSLHYDRCVFYNFRNIIKYEAIKNIDGKWLRNIRMRCDDDLMRPLYKSYPYHRFHIKQRVFFFCMKYRIIPALYLMGILENKINKVI